MNESIRIFNLKTCRLLIRRAELEREIKSRVKYGLKPDCAYNALLGVDFEIKGLELSLDNGIKAVF